MAEKTARRSGFIGGIFLGRCPNCRIGKVFQSPSIFPLGKLTDLHEHCPHCGQKLKHEINNGGGINYALTVLLFFLNLCWYWPIVGISYEDNSVEWFLVVSISVVVLAQPWLMRLSRMLYLYMYIPFHAK